ncbi:MAG: hypothetical protein ACLSHC_11100 [Bilophila wadsworthia]
MISFSLLVTWRSGVSVQGKAHGVEDGRLPHLGPVIQKCRPTKPDRKINGPLRRRNEVLKDQMRMVFPLARVFFEE